VRIGSRGLSSVRLDCHLVG